MRLHNDPFSNRAADLGNSEESTTFLQRDTPCGTSIAENAKFGLYYEPPSRRCKKDYRFIGVYNQKIVAYVGVVEAITVVSQVDGTSAFTPEAGTLTDAHKQRIADTIEATPYYDLTDRPLRYYLVDQFMPTNARKISQGGIMGLRYLDLSVMVQKYQARKYYTSAELAEALKDATWV